MSIETIKARLEAATTGPWGVREITNGKTGQVSWWIDVEGPPTWTTVAEMTEEDGTEVIWSRHDAMLIAQAPTDLRLLLDVAEAALALQKTLHRPRACYECYRGGGCRAPDYLGSECEAFPALCAALAKLGAEK